MLLSSLAASDGIHQKTKLRGDMHFSARQSKATNPPSHDEASRSLTRPVPSNHPLDHPLLELQPAIGNQGVQRLLHSQPVQGLRPSQGGLLQRKCACGGTPGPDGECAECRQKRLSRRRIGLPIGPWRASTTTHKDPRHRRARTRYKSEWCSARSIQSRLFTEVPSTTSLAPCSAVDSG
jgi:hypothetical protein